MSSIIPKLSLVPIGKVIDKNTVYIYEKFSKALKYLNQFSHSMVFSECDGQIKHYIIKVLKVDEKKGLVYIDNINVDDNTKIYDLKPYFPCEDRIKEVIESNKNKDEWRSDCNISLSKNKEIELDSMDKVKKENYEKVSIIGGYQCNNGTQLICFDNDFDFEKLYGYSHGRIIWWFNRFDSSNFRQKLVGKPPYEDAPETGIFATRSPVRPNPIATTVVQLKEINSISKTIVIQGFDGFEHSLIIDIVPYESKNDRVKYFKLPLWLEHWPQWKTFRNSNLIDGNLNLGESGVQKFNQFIFNENEIILNENQTENEYDSHEIYKKYPDKICIYNANQNNLKNISIEFPKNKVSIITGVSGSGKSSLAFDTIYAESQRLFMDIMGSDRDNALEKPMVEQITGLQPAISIEQKSLGRNPRSTVGTITGISDLLRLLFTTIGVRHCPECYRGIEALSEDGIINALLKLEENIKLTIQPFNQPNEGQAFIVENNKKYNEIIKEFIKISLKKGNGAIEVTINDEEPILLQTKQYCYHCDRLFFDLTASVFSFNNPDYMCPTCKGLGLELKVDEQLIITNEELSILDGASKWWGNLRKHMKSPNANWMRGEVLALSQDMNVDLEVPYKDLPEDFKHQIMYGSSGRKVKLSYKNKTGRQGEIIRPVEGVVNAINRLFKNNSSDRASSIVEQFLSKDICSTCNGERLSAEGRLIDIESVRYPIAANMKIIELKEWIHELKNNVSKDRLKVSYSIIERLDNQLDKIIKVGLSYLSLDRSIPTLSGGESQRLRLASQFGTNLTNILYVLDEPSMGLHPKDYKFLVEQIKELKDMGNTIIMVEHEKDIILSADYIVDIGPSAGKYGGEIIAVGTVEEITSNKNSLTGKYLKTFKTSNNRLKNDITIANKNRINLYGAKANNLKNIDVQFPLESFICITGVSGSGKSSLVSDTLYPAIAKKLGQNIENIGKHERISGLENIENIVWVSQQPIGRTPRSNPATYTGVFDLIRNLFTKIEESKNRNYKKEHFSFNSKKGQCPICTGAGRIQTVLHFMPDIWTTCTTCQGKRYKSEVLEIMYKGYTIADVLEMDVDEALGLFKEDRKIQGVLQMLQDVGLGYIKLGQSALTLSGGEAQRIKLAKELSQSKTNRTIYILDEPTTGLHFIDIEKLLEIIVKLTKRGNTVIAIEHNIEFVKNADWIIDMGPSGGENGGYIVAEGTPFNIANNSNSTTGEILIKTRE